jgi:hypothetical protein
MNTVSYCICCISLFYPYHFTVHSAPLLLHHGRHGRRRASSATLSAPFSVLTDARACGGRTGALAADGEVAASELALAGRLVTAVLAPKTFWAEQVQPSGPAQFG